MFDIRPLYRQRHGRPVRRPGPGRPAERACARWSGEPCAAPGHLGAFRETRWAAPMSERHSLSSSWPGSSPTCSEEPIVFFFDNSIKPSLCSFSCPVPGYWEAFLAHDTRHFVRVQFAYLVGRWSWNACNLPPGLRARRSGRSGPAPAAAGSSRPSRGTARWRRNRAKNEKKDANWCATPAQSRAPSSPTGCSVPWPPRFPCVKKRGCLRSTGTRPQRVQRMPIALQKGIQILPAAKSRPIGTS